MIDFSIVRKKYRVYIPSEMMNQKYTGPVYGFYHEATGVFNITGSMSTNGESVIGEISQAKPENSSDLLCGYWEDLYDVWISVLISRILGKGICRRDFLPFARKKHAMLQMCIRQWRKPF